ncbi:putative phage head protein [Candidatus Termititenax aidoneus]|uniref:Phage head protein n=1 Tax=Termititenax aidoneus TaxID=2218524 RepID=A0A388TC92_TERA1|nr:putative phage head protein [Candidatus Termititenax aidoneus]
MPVAAPQLKDSYWQLIEDQLIQQFYDKFFKQLFAIVNTPLEKINSKNDLIAAINSGRIVWNGKYYRGQLNSRISAELRKIAAWDRRAKAFRGAPPTWLLGQITIAASNSDKMLAALTRAVRELDIPKIVDEIADNIDYIPTARNISTDVSEGLGIVPEYNSDLVRQRINKDFATRIDRSIKNFSENQTTRLRNLVEKMATGSLDRRHLRQTIQDEFNVSKTRAKFIARQETNLFFSEQRDAQAQKSGRKYYLWKATDFSDRTRAFHKALDSRASHQIYDITNPPLDTIDGQHHNPGTNYNCRCSAIFLNDGEVEEYLKRGYKIAFGPKTTPKK